MSEEKEFEGTIDASILKDVLSALTAVVDEGVLRFSEEGVTSKPTDPANVAMVSLDVKRDIFSEYNLEGEELAVGMDFGRLRNILKVGDSDVQLKLNTNKMQMKLGNLSYNMSLFAVDALRKEPKIPELEYPASVTIKATEFKRGINTADKVADWVEIGINSEEFFMDAEGDDKFKLVIPKDNFAPLAFNAFSQELQSKYSLEYLKSMVKGITNDTVTLKINKDYPIQMWFKVVDDCEVMYLLAPRIEADD